MPFNSCSVVVMDPPGFPGSVGFSSSSDSPGSVGYHGVTELGEPEEP